MRPQAGRKPPDKCLAIWSPVSDARKTMRKGVPADDLQLAGAHRQVAHEMRGLKRTALGGLGARGAHRMRAEHSSTKPVHVSPVAADVAVNAMRTVVPTYFLLVSRACSSGSRVTALPLPTRAASGMHVQPLRRCAAVQGHVGGAPRLAPMATMVMLVGLPLGSLKGAIVVVAATVTAERLPACTVCGCGPWQASGWVVSDRVRWVGGAQSG